MRVDESQIRQWYEQELVSDAEIARRLGTHQVWVSRYRRKWGIPTISKTERLALQLPSELTSEQDQLLIGSLMGDGWMSASSQHSARFQDGHCWKQAAYTEWKATVLGAFVSYVRTREGLSSSGTPYKSRNLATRACPQLRPYYDLFYPPPDRKRVFPPDLYKRMTPLVLAVWYMDDGNCTTSQHPRISFGLDSLSLKRAMRALRTLGLKPKVYGDKGDEAIWFPKQAFLFRQLIEPHVLDCMAFKLPTESPRQKGDRNARKLTPERAAELYTGGMSTHEVAVLYGVGDGTVSRRLKTAGVKKRRSGPRKPSYSREAAHALLERYDPEEWPNLSTEDQDRWVQEVLRVLRASPFPGPVPYDIEACEKSLEKVRVAELTLDEGNCLRPIRRVGIGCCTSFFPNRYRAASRGIRTAHETWHQDKHLERAIRFQLKFGDPVLPHRVLRAVTMNCRTPTVFRPTVARFVYERYCPLGGKVWDPCAGYGGRVMGAAAAGVQYVGTDVDPETIEGNFRLTKALGYSAELNLCPAEEFEPPAVDLVFTSPPYFNRERYSNEGDQSWRRHGDDFNTWVEGFLRPVVRKAYQASPTLVLNVCDVRHRRGVHPLEETTVRVVSEEGFHLEETLYMPLPKLNREDPKEPLFVFRR